MGPELRQLRYFVAVAEELNFTRAAERMQIAQPSLSAQIQQLERQLGCQLLVRTTRKVRLTRVGRIFLEQAQRVLAANDELDVVMRAAIDSSTREVLTVAVSPDAEPYVADRLLAFAVAHDSVDLVITPGSDRWIIELVGSGRLDAGVVWTGNAAGEDRLRASPVAAVPTLLALRVDDPLARLDEIPIAAIADRPLLMFPRAVGPGIWDALVGQLRPGGSSAPVHEITSASAYQQAMLRAVATGAGLAPTSPAHVAALGLPDLVARPTVPRLRAALELVTSTQPSAPAKSLAHFLAADPDRPTPVPATHDL